MNLYLDESIVHETVRVTPKDRAASTARCSCGLALTGVSIRDARTSIRRHVAYVARVRLDAKIRQGNFATA